jgi:hypothetical protein
MVEKHTCFYEFLGGKKLLHCWKKGAFYAGCRATENATYKLHRKNELKNKARKRFVSAGCLF